MSAGVEGLFPVSAAGQPGRAVEAADAVAALVRFLNHATREPAAGTLRYAGEVSAVLAGLERAAGRWEQLCGQLAVRVEALADDPALYTTAPGAATDRVWSAAEALWSARGTSRTVAGQLGAAHAAVATLGHDTAGDDTGDHQDGDGGSGGLR